MIKPQKLTKKNAILIATGFLLVFVLMLSYCLSSLINKYHISRNETRVHAELQSERITHTVNDKLLYLRALESLAIRDNGELDNFQSIAASVVGKDPCVRCVQFAKDGKITPETIYPYEGNEAGVGDLLSPSSPRYETALMVLEKRTTVLSIPKDGKLHQGGLGLIARRAIFLTDDHGNEQFWGFVVLIMDLSKIIEQAGFGSTSEAYSYSIHGTDAAGQNLLLSGQETISRNPIELKFMPGGDLTWTLTIKPIDGWVNRGIIGVYAVMLLIVVLLTIFLTLFATRAGRFYRMYKTLSQYDELSHLLNKRSFNEFLQRYTIENRSFTLFVIDINKFKDFNDSYGHSIGDALIRETADRIKKNIPVNAEAFRIGGDEFAVICFEDTQRSPETQLEALARACAQPFSYEELTLDVSVSCGCAVYPDDATTPDKLLQLADTQMYQKKNEYNKSFPLTVREHLFRSINYYIRNARREGDNSRYYFFHMDYQNFKFLNFYYGIEEGDALIRRTIDYNRSNENCVLCCRGNADNIFALVKARPDTDQDEIKRKFELHIAPFLEKEQKHFPDVHLAVWCGYSRVRDTHLIDAVGRANLAKCMAKKTKSGTPVFIDEHQTMEYMQKKKLEQEILFALNDGNIRYVLQPQIDIGTGKMVSAEVLGRMYKTTGETISPLTFVPVLERNGSIVEFDLSILKLVCADLRKRLDNGKPVVPVSLNVSKMHILSNNTPARIREILNSYELPPDLFCFEITEMWHPINGNDIVTFCNSLREIGVKISLDDLGAGDTDISLIKDALVDELKLDKRFLTGNTEQLARHMNVLQSIVKMAQLLNIRVVCEGVENIRQYEMVKNAGVSLIQGFYYSKPEDQKTIYKQFLEMQPAWNTDSPTPLTNISYNSNGTLSAQDDALFTENDEHDSQGDE